nr:serine/arginine repetitive matrix protein 2-like [Ipomoea batatas]
MSDSDSQDISRDYDGEFPVASPSSSRTRSIEEGAGDSTKTGRSAQDTTPGGDEEESGRRDQEPNVETVPPFGPGKSPRRVIEALTVEYQSLSPVSRAKHVAALPDPEKFRPAPPSSSSAPSSAAPTSSSRPSTSEPILTGKVESLPLDNDDVRKHSCLLTHFELEEISSLLSGRTKALREAVIKISSESYEYSIFRTPESYAAAQLQAPDYTQEEKYIPKRVDVTAAIPPPVASSGKGDALLGMVLDKSFAAPAGSKRIRKKVTLGSLKSVVDPLGTTRGTDVQVTRPLRRKWKEGITPADAEVVTPAKRQKRSSPPGSTPVLDALREGGEQTASLFEKIRTMVPDREHIRSLATDQVGEHIAQDLLRLSHMTTNLFCRATAAENLVRRGVDPLKRSLAEKEKENEDIKGQISALERRAVEAEKEAAETKEKMTNYESLAAFLCRERAEADAFFRAFLQNKVGEDLTWSYGQWAYTKGQHAMQQEVYTTLTESLSDHDLASILEIMPDDVSDPGPNPYANSSSSAGVDADQAAKPSDEKRTRHLACSVKFTYRVLVNLFVDVLSFISRTPTVGTPFLGESVDRPGPWGRAKDFRNPYGQTRSRSGVLKFALSASISSDLYGRAEPEAVSVRTGIGGALDRSLVLPLGGSLKHWAPAHTRVGGIRGAAAGTDRLKEGNTEVCVATTGKPDLGSLSGLSRMGRARGLPHADRRGLRGLYSRGFELDLRRPDLVRPGYLDVSASRRYQRHGS